MMNTEDIRQYFDSLQEYEVFRLRWIRACAKLNKDSRNAELLPQAKERVRVMERIKARCSE